MRSSGVLERFRSLSSCDISASTLSDLRDRTNDIRVIRAWLDSQQAQVVEALAAFDSVTPEVELIRESGLSSSDIRKVMARSEVIKTAPVFGEALSKGSVASGHLDALANGFKILGDQADRLVERSPQLLSTAQTMTSDEFSRYIRQTAQALSDDGGIARFEKQRRRTHLRHWVDAEGMINLFGKFDPERGSVVTALLDAGVEALFRSGDAQIPVECDASVEPNDHRRAVALVAMLQGAAESTAAESAKTCVRDRPARAEIVVHIDLDTLRHGLDLSEKRSSQTCRTLNGVELPVETVRRLACEADIIPLVLDGQSVPLDVGKSKRLATAYQRRALAAVHETCAIEGCAVKFSLCQPHHIDYWENGGPTDLQNLVPLCSRHHHAAHEGGWKLVLDSKTRILRVL